MNEWHGWQPDNQKPLCCNQTIQSSHPYLPSTDSYQTVSFPGASKVSIFFDTNCATEEERDYVTIYRDETFTDFWGKKKKISGTDGWPGSGGRPPMVIPSDSFVVHFHSDASIQNWGFKLDAKAPVNLEKATQLLEKEKEKQEKQENWRRSFVEHTMLGLYACQRALAECLNDYEAAIVWMNENRTLLLQEEKEQQEEKRRLDENNGGDPQVLADTVVVMLAVKKMKRRYLIGSLSECLVTKIYHFLPYFLREFILRTTYKIPPAK